MINRNSAGSEPGRNANHACNSRAVSEPKKPSPSFPPLLGAEGRAGWREEYTFPLEVLWSLADHAALLEASDAAFRGKLDRLRKHLQKLPPYSGHAQERYALPRGDGPPPMKN